MEGIRELKTFENNKRTLSFNAKFPLGRIDIRSEFQESRNFISSEEYAVSARWTLVKQKRMLQFDHDAKTISASGKFTWLKELPDNQEIFDPLNAQIQMRKNVISGMESFSILLPEIKTGKIESNDYQLNPDATCNVGDQSYQCRVVKRERPQENRTTIYYLAPELGYMIVKIEDQDADGDTLLEMKGLL